MVGQGEQGEPEGAIISRMSGEAVESSSSGNTPFFLFGIKLSPYLCQSYSFITTGVLFFFQELIHLINTSTYQTF